MALSRWETLLAAPFMAAVLVAGCSVESAYVPEREGYEIPADATHVCSGYISVPELNSRLFSMNTVGVLDNMGSDFRPHCDVYAWGRPYIEGRPTLSLYILETETPEELKRQLSYRKEEALLSIGGDSFAQKSSDTGGSNPPEIRAAARLDDTRFIGLRNDVENPTQELVNEYHQFILTIRDRYRAKHKIPAPRTKFTVGPEAPG